MSKVIDLFGTDITANQVLDGCIDQFDKVLVIGRHAEDGFIKVRHDDSMTLEQMIYYLEATKIALIRRMQE